MEKTNNPELNQPRLRNETLLLHEIRENIQTFCKDIQQELAPEDSKKNRRANIKMQFCKKKCALKIGKARQRKNQ